MATTSDATAASCSAAAGASGWVVDGSFDGDEVIVIGTAAIESLHSWSQGGFGELLRGVIPGSTPSLVYSLHLSPLEAFFLLEHKPYARVRVYDARAAPAAPADDAAASSGADGGGGGGGSEQQPMSTQACWEAFGRAVPQFARTYAVFRSLRAAGWHLRDGLKFGVDFALYDPSLAPESHAVLGAIVVGSEPSAERSWLWLQQHTRVCRSVAKGLMLCSVGPSVDECPLDESTPACLDHLPVIMLEVQSCSASKEHAKLSK